MTKLHDAPIIDVPSKEQLEATRPYEELEITPAIQQKIEKMMKFFDDAGIDYSKFDPENVERLDFSKKDAYPNYEAYFHIPGQHNTKKWLDAVREIYRHEKDGNGRVQAIRQATSGWNVMETYDFLNWLKYHESGDHLKYKFAQLWYENGAPGYFLHVKPDAPKAAEPAVTGKDIDFARDSVAEELTKNERKQLIEKQRNKIIGRLDSAEKLLRSPDGQIFSGKEFESLMEAIYQLKKKIQLVNKISSSTRLYEDMIVREANILQRGGFSKAAEMLHSIAQTAGQSGEEIGGGTGKDTLPPAAPPDDPSGAGHPGAPGGLPSMGPGMPQNPAESAPETGLNEMSPTQMGDSGKQPETSAVAPVSLPIQKTPKSKGIAEFLENMNTSKITTPENQGAEDGLEVDDTIHVAEANDYLLVTEAQVAPVDEPMTTSPAPAPLNPAPVAPPAAPMAEEPLEVTEDAPAPTGEMETPVGEEVAPSGGGFDDKVDALLANVTIADIVVELENLAKVFKVREIPRRLALVDMMLDSKGLASYFPSLSEAQNKALESNNYISTRVEDILSKLRGATATQEVDLKGGEEKESPDVTGIKSKLQQDEDKEKQRKKMRKEQEAAELEGAGKETPEVEIAEDLGAPAAPKAPAAPRPPVPTPPA